ncbi:acetyltransferase [Bacillus sp. FJAT-27245]|uniref:acetyltransferase n=1 Tax=Bacillus sp. FJAT-27245 TaxID=1684144 RepID=UPI0006A79564|nr:acetyltransferase [Bacillus sp. FJAT-27245]
MKNVVVFGSGRHSKVIIDILERMGSYRIIGLIDEAREIGEQVMGYNVIGDLTVLKTYPHSIMGGIVAVGDNGARRELVNEIVKIDRDFIFIRAIHPSAVIGKYVSIGRGTAVMANAVINSDTTIGDHCIINTKSSIDHDCRLGNFVSIAPGSTLAGGVTVGNHSTISLGANVIHNITIGEHTVVGAGSTVIKNIHAYAVAYGTPAKKIRARAEDEKYL